MLDRMLMKKKKLWTFLFLPCLLLPALACGAASGAIFPDIDLEKAVLYLTGAADLESLPEDEMERWHRLAESPLAINLAGRGRMESSGLMTAYQIASLLDYRFRSGDILSISELAAVDGFGKEAAEALSCFISLESSAMPGRTSGTRKPPRNVLTAGGGDKLKIAGEENPPEQSWCWYGRYGIEEEERYSAGISLKRYWSDSQPWPSSVSGSVAFSGRRHLEKVVLGDFSLRFGQGLALWTGFSMSGFSGPRSFWKRPSGISPSGAYSAASSVRGAAAELSFGRIGVSAFVAFPGFREWCEAGKPLAFSMMPGANVSWYSRHGQVSATYFSRMKTLSGRGQGSGSVIMLGNRWCADAGKVSADARFCVHGTELFCEAALDLCSMKTAAAGGFVAKLSDRWKAALSGRYFPDGYSLEYCSPVRAYSGSGGETGVAAGLFFRDMELTSDWAASGSSGRNQLKVAFKCPVRLAPSWSMLLRVRERWRSYGVRSRTDVRADLKLASEKWPFSACGMAAVSREASWLAYVEQGCSVRRWTAYLRGTLFAADSWDSRLYCYERDVPGGFNVLAFYGRGYSISMYVKAGFHLGDAHRRSRLKLYFRAGYSDVPWHCNGHKRPARADAKLQMTYDF